jgi:hypothetical protein
MVQVGAVEHLVETVMGLLAVAEILELVEEAQMVAILETTQPLQVDLEQVEAAVEETLLEAHLQERQVEHMFYYSHKKIKMIRSY